MRAFQVQIKRSFDSSSPVDISVDQQLGIGAKYATFLVNQFGSLENMYRCCAQKERGEGLNGLVRRILRHAPGQSSAATTDRQVASATKKATKVCCLNVQMTEVKVYACASFI